MKSEFSFSGFFGICAVLVVCFAMVILSYTPVSAIAGGGMAAAETSAAHYYDIKARPVLNETTVAVDWNNVEALTGQELYNDGQSVITVTGVEAVAGGNYALHLEAVGEIASSGGRVVTPLSHDGSLPEGYIQVTVGENTYISKAITERGQSALRAGDTAVMTIFADDVPADEIATNGNQVTVQLLGLQKITFER